MVINHNISALNTFNQMSKNEKAQQSSLQKLSSGLRINSAADDAAGLAISQKMTAQVNGLDQASSNAQNGISLVQTAEGALNETQSILQRMRELAVQSATDTNTADDREKLQAETDQLSQEITRISNTTEFNTKNLLAGGFQGDTFQIGANADQNLQLSISAMDAKTLGVTSDRSYLNTYTDGGTATGLSSSNIGAVGKGLVAGNDYTITNTHTSAVNTVKSDGGVTGSVTAGGSYTGDTDQLGVEFKVTSISGTSGSATIGTAMYSTDGGNTWSAADTSVANKITYNGATLTFGSTMVTGDVGKVITVDFSAQYDSIQLKKGGTNIGNAAKVYHGQNTVTVGNAATSQTLQINSNTLGQLTNNATATIAIATTASSAAVTSADGNIQTKAVAVAGIDISTQSAANTAITTIDKAINMVSQQRSNLGALQNRLTHTINNLSVESQNLQSASSQITDVDMAKEMTQYSKYNILNQAAQAMLAQANQLPQGILQLLK